VAFNDPFAAAVILESTKIQIVHSTTFSKGPDAIKTTADNVKTNVELLDDLDCSENNASHHVSNSSRSSSDDKRS
jgi:hypothetical protein